MTEAEAEAAFEAMIREIKDTEARRTKVGVGAADATYRDVFNPARDGDCLMRCAVKHDFDGSDKSAAEAGPQRRPPPAAGRRSGVRLETRATKAERQQRR
jgi:hypothetical protein